MTEIAGTAPGSGFRSQHMASEKHTKTKGRGQNWPSSLSTPSPPPRLAVMPFFYYSEAVNASIARNGLTAEPSAENRRPAIPIHPPKSSRIPFVSTGAVTGTGVTPVMRLNSCAEPSALLMIRLAPCEGRLLSKTPPWLPAGVPWKRKDAPGANAHPPAPDPS